MRGRAGTAPTAPPPSPPQPAAASPSPTPPETPTVTGDLDPQLVAAHVRSQLPKVKACYEQALANNRELVGKIAMHWTIDTEGVTRGIVVESNTMQPSSVPDCVKAVIAAWRFPQPTGGPVDVSFPFVFSSSR